MPGEGNGNPQLFTRERCIIELRWDRESLLNVGLAIYENFTGEHISFCLFALFTNPQKSVLFADINNWNAS